MSQQATTEEIARANEWADSIERVAAMIRANPGVVADELKFSFYRINVPVDTKDQLAAVVRAGLAAGAKVRKDFREDSQWAGAVVLIGLIELYVYASREQVCERVVTGTREVTEEVPDPEALAAIPTVRVTKTVEDVEWICSPLLAQDGA